MARVQHTDLVIGAGAGVVVTLTKRGTSTPAILWAGPTGETTLAELVTNEFGFYSVWLDEGEYDESVEQSPQEDRVLSILSYQSLRAAAEVKEGPQGEKGTTGEKGEKGTTGEPGTAAGGYQTGDLIFTHDPAETRAGALRCEGQVYSPSTYAALYAKIGHQEGGTAEAPLLPDYRGRSPMGAGKGTGGEESETFPSRALGQRLGRLVHKLTAGQMPKHGHTATDAGHVHTTPPVLSPAVGADFGNNAYAGINGSNNGVTGSPSTGSTKANVTNSETGGSEIHPNVHPSTVCLVWIKT